MVERFPRWLGPSLRTFGTRHSHRGVVSRDNATIEPASEVSPVILNPRTVRGVSGFVRSLHRLTLIAMYTDSVSDRPPLMGSDRSVVAGWFRAAGW